MLLYVFITLENFIIAAPKNTFVFKQAFLLVRFCLISFKVRLALVAPKVYLIEYVQHNPVHPCCPKNVATTRAITTFIQPRIDALFANKSVTAAALLRFHHDFSADYAKEFAVNQVGELRINFKGVRVGKL